MRLSCFRDVNLKLMRAEFGMYSVSPVILVCWRFFSRAFDMLLMKEVEVRTRIELISGRSDTTCDLTWFKAWARGDADSSWMITDESNLVRLVDGWSVAESIVVCKINFFKKTEERSESVV